MITGLAGDEETMPMATEGTRRSSDHYRMGEPRLEPFTDPAMRGRLDVQ